MKKYVFASILITIPILCVELFCAVFSEYFGKHFFSYEPEYMRQVKAADFERFTDSPYFDPHLGWNNPKAVTHAIRENCIGENIEYSYSDSARITPGSALDQSEIALFGESFTQGEEVRDDQTIASVLTQKYRLRTANYGVNAYDPLQAIEKFEGVVAQPHSFRVAALLVMHENIWRLVNSFKPVYVPYYNEFYFGLKPYVQGNKFIELSYPATYDQFIHTADSRFQNDYWSKPERKFPYSFALGRALYSNWFRAQFHARSQGRFRYEYQSSDEFRGDLAASIDRFVGAADAHAIVPFVVFIPKSKDTYGVSANYVAEQNARLHRPIAYEFDDAGMDWSRYRLSSDIDYCHPSPYGYERIADFVAGIIKKNTSLTSAK